MYECSLQTKPIGPPHARSVFFFFGVNMQEVLFLYLREVSMQLLQLYLS